eukprot:TRINITY_DN2613_c0_g1_i3.p1 TRINITY_DN2613_c0_g1~~TRINITY_DN2613_c0_g1_i3.p1  ORF type:complete len:312 (+),score=71.08 TRINITY_DN2613_c0_g1_i3:567-1502(+)
MAPWNFTESDGTTLQIASVVYQDETTRDLFVDLVKKRFDSDVAANLIELMVDLEETILESAIVTIARIYSFDRANVFAEGGVGVIWEGDSVSSSRDEETTQTPYGPMSCSYRYCLRDVNNTQQLEDLVDSFEDGDVLMFVGQEAFDEIHSLAGATAKFVVIRKNDTSGETELVDMLFERLSPPPSPSIPILPSRVLMTRSINPLLLGNESDALSVAGLAIEGWSDWEFVLANRNNSEAKPYKCGEFDPIEDCLQTTYTQVFGKLLSGSVDPVLAVINGLVNETFINMNIADWSMNCSPAYKMGYCSSEKNV